MSISGQLDEPSSLLSVSSPQPQSQSQSQSQQPQQQQQNKLSVKSHRPRQRSGQFLLNLRPTAAAAVASPVEVSGQITGLVSGCEPLKEMEDESEIVHDEGTGRGDTKGQAAVEPAEEQSSLHLLSSEGRDLEEGEEEGEKSLDERAMRRHFQDVESSFLPGPGEMVFSETAEGAANVGPDDTYLELAGPGKGGDSSDEARLEGFSDAYVPSMGGRDAATEDDSHSGDGTGQLREGDVGFSSPAQAAAQRGHARVVSAMSAARLASLRSNATSFSGGFRGEKSGQSSRPSTADSQRPVSKGSTLRASSPPPPQNVALPESALGSSNNTLSRSSHLSSKPAETHRRQGSYLSSNSSNTQSTDQSGGNDDSLEADYSHRLLRRLPSFGNAGSYVDKDSDSARSITRDTSGSSLLASMRGGASRFGEAANKTTDERPETPRGNLTYRDAPTDTVIAQHVQSIQVPETIARDFRARNRSLSPNKRPTSAGQQQGVGGGTFQAQPARKTMTLKEQNSKIDKLTKENFDLKLKIHFLDQALQSRSEDGVKDLIDRNVQFQTDLANERKETQSLRRKIRELERKLKDQEADFQRQQQAQQRSSTSDEDEDPLLQAEMHEEILMLRQELDRSENRVTELEEKFMTTESEKRRMAERIRGMASSRGADSAGLRETESMWQDLLQAEQARREQAEEDAHNLREELTALRIERASPTFARSTKRRSRVEAERDEVSEFGNGASSAVDSAMLDQLRRQIDELKHQSGAQTSMLKSRNREIEMLRSDKDELKLLLGKSDGARSVAGESIFERSISRAHQRAPSRASEAITAVTETEREDWEKKEGQLRDQNAELRLKYQELERTHGTHLQYIATLESDFQEMENEVNENAEDLRALQSERDEALQAYEDKESEYEKLREEAVLEIERLEKRNETLSTQLEDSQKRLQKTQTKLEHTSDGYRGLQGELREITHSVLNLEDEKQANVKTIQTLEQQLAEAEEELQKWDEKCKEIDQKNRKLEISQENLHSQLNFVREDQDSDKLRIGELEHALSAAQQTVLDEQEKLREMEEGIVEERQQRDVLENKSKEEVQKVLDGLNTENGKTKDEVRRLRRGLSAKEVEATGWKQKLEELEQSLRDILGEPDGSRQSLLAEIEKVQRDLESTASNLDRTKMELADKDRLLRHREGLLESTSLESRRLSDLLDKERASRKHELEQFEKASRGQATQMRTIVQHETRVMELESAYVQEQRKLAALREQYDEQLHDRNHLLLAVWNRLSTLCGTEWAQRNALVNGEIPSVDVIARNLPSFNKNLMHALKTVESLIGSFKVRIRGVERDLSKDYETLEQSLNIRMQRLEMLEQQVEEYQRFAAEQATAQQQQQRPSASRTVSGKSNEEIARLKSEIKVLKAERKFQRQQPSGSEQSRRGSIGGSNAAAGKTSPARQIVNLLRHHSTSTVEQMPVSSEDGNGLAQQQSPPMPPPSSSSSVMAQQQQRPLVYSSSSSVHPNERKWNHQLKELERRLKAEREGRLLDRQNARERLKDGLQENEQLRQLLEHAQARSAVAEEFPLGGPARRQSDSGVD